MPGLTYKSRTGRWVIAATVLGSGIASLDATVVGIALPAIGHDFHVGVAALQWVVDAYTLSLAGLLLLGGTLGDRYGRRRVFVIGTIWFALASLLCGLAPNDVTLILARALQGVGAALLTPGSLAILQASFVQKDRSAAIGAWSGLGGLASAIGPFLGGWLISAVSWRLVFFINLPVAAAVVAMSSRHVPESKAPDETGKLDVPGAVAITGALVGITYGLIDASSAGWSSIPVLASLIGGLILLAAFIVIESRSPAPMLPLHVFASRQFSAANVVTFVVYAALSGALFLLPTVLQVAAGYSPLASGAAFLPVTVIMLALSARSGALAARIGPRLQMSVGPVVIAAGLVLLTRIGTTGDYLTEVLPAVVVFGLGLAINVAPLTSTAMSAVPAEHSGIASAVNNDVARAAGLIAVAVLPVAAGITGDSYLHPAALSHGFRNAVLIAAAACVVGGLLAFLTIRNPPRTQAAPEGQGQDDLDESQLALHCALDAPPLTCENTQQRILGPPRGSKGVTGTGGVAGGGAAGGGRADGGPAGGSTSAG
jgi:EmrB/QacA subfamily drug resistance transporter